MPKEKTARRKAGRTTREVLRETWSATLASLASAQQEMEKQVRRLMKENKISGKDAARMLGELRARAEKERKRALKELESRLKALQARVKKERKVVGRAVNDTVQRALAALNIPSRQEIGDLTRRVEELSKKIDSFKKRR